MSDKSTGKAPKATFGALALEVAFLITVVATVASGSAGWPIVWAILLSILGVGLRIEAAIESRGSGKASEPNVDAGQA